MTPIRPQQAQDLLQANGLLVDVRTPAEFREVHAVGAHNIPLDTVTPDLIRQLTETDIPDEKIAIICGSGRRSKVAIERLQASGMNGLHNVEGGTDGWVEAGLPVHRGDKTISIERQTRIAAGLLIMAGVLIGAFIHPGGYVLSFFVGAGLTFAGMTDTCGMGMLLARMPWNR